MKQGVIQKKGEKFIHRVLHLLEFAIAILTLAVLVGMFQGGIQALSRSYLAKIIPPERSGEYFGMMDTFGKGADAIGPAIIALVTNLVGDRTVTVFGTQLRGQNLGVGFLVLLFIIGFVLFAKADRLNKERRKASV